MKGVRLDIRLAEWEMDLLRGMAKDRALTLSAFVRSVLFEGAARVAESAVDVASEPPPARKPEPVVVVPDFDAMDSVPTSLPEPDVVSVGSDGPAVATLSESDEEKVSTFRRSKKCTSERCGPRLGATCKACH